MAETMRAWQVTRQGAPAEVLELVELPVPEPGPGQVLVRVAAAACNFPDVLLCHGTYQERPSLPFTPGLEISGEVVATGRGADAAVEDRVIGTPPLPAGGYAEYVLLDSWYPWPRGMTPGQAAGLFITYQTGVCALHHRAALRAGEVLLVHAAAGGVGSAAVQLGSAAGATVIGTAGGKDKCETARKLGAERVVDYRETDVVDAVKELTGGHGADVVFDPVGGSVFEASRRAAAFEGRVLVIGFAGGEIPSAPANHVLVKNYSVVGVHWGMYRTKAPELIDRWQDTISELWDRRAIDPLVGAELPFEQAPKALDDLASRATVGKVVLVP
jgi:NADPH2:quinone reductase